jgi:hypothetical protein
MCCRSMITTVIAIFAGHGTAWADENVKSFQLYQCRYTLPSDDWSWAELASGTDAVFMAQNGDGLVLTMSVHSAPAGRVIDSRFATEFDQTAPTGVEFRKRGGRFMTFRGLSCYQHEGIFNGRTTVVRVVIANGLLYQLELLGDADPVEKRPDFESIMNGFEFTSPPVPPHAADPHRTTRIARGLGSLCAYSIPVTAVFLIYLGVRTGRRK